MSSSIRDTIFPRTKKLELTGKSRGIVENLLSICFQCRKLVLYAGHINLDIWFVIPVMAAL